MAESNRHLRKHKDNSTGFKGVTFFKRDSNYRAQICIDGKNTHIGYYKTKEDAAIAYNEKAKIIYGKYAVLNEVNK